MRPSSPSISASVYSFFFFFFFVSGWAAARASFSAIATSGATELSDSPSATISSSEASAFSAALMPAAALFAPRVR